MKSRNNLYSFLLIGMVVVAMGATFVIGEPLGATGTTTVSSSRLSLSNSSTATALAEAGNVTALNIEAQQVTQTWQGYYGNVSGSIVLASSDNYNFYTWSASVGEVYASRNDSVTWQDIACIDAGNVSAENSYLGVSAGNTESINSTYNTTTHPGFDVGTVSVSGCMATNAYSNNATSSTLWYQVLLADSASNIVYTTLMNDSSTSFRNDNADFQLLVGENGRGGNASILTTYYFYVELG